MNWRDPDPSTERLRLLVGQSVTAALEAYGRGDFAAAALELGGLLPELEPEVPELWYLLGNSCFHLGRYRDAVDALLHVARAGTADDRAFLRLGVSCMELQEWESAARHFAAAIDFRRNDPRLWNDLAIARARSGHLLGARTCVEEAIRLDPRRGELWKNLGNVFRDLGCRQDAIEAYREAVRLEPERPEYWSDLGTAFSLEGRAAEADAALRKALRLKPDDPDTWHNLAVNATADPHVRVLPSGYQRLIEPRENLAADAPAHPRSRGRVLPFRLPSEEPSS